MVEQNFFNENNGIYPDVDSSILTHTIGNPLSYPSRVNAEGADLWQAQTFFFDCNNR